MYSKHCIKRVRILFEIKMFAQQSQPCSSRAKNMFWNTRNAPQRWKTRTLLKCFAFLDLKRSFFCWLTWLWRAWLVHTFTSLVEAVSLASNNVHYLNFSSVECVSFTSASSTSSVARSLPLFAFALGRHREKERRRVASTMEKEAFPPIEVAFEWKFCFGRDDGECLSKKFINWSRSLSPGFVNHCRKLCGVEEWMKSSCQLHNIDCALEARESSRSVVIKVTQSPISKIGTRTR